MKLTRRQLMKNGLLLGASVPLSLGAAWASDVGLADDPAHGSISLFGVDRSTTELGQGLRQQGWTPRYEGRLDPLALNAQPAGALATGFTDEAGLVLLTSLLAGRGRVLALGRHDAGQHRLLSHRGPIAAPLAVDAGSWQAALGREYARLATASGSARHSQDIRRPYGESVSATELSFLVRL
ncbi:MULTISPECIES: hypothetical protein [unclassified Halomonas]|uniref:hypothetical protein n=1 Tax=unclassified Halomonas TaxID=2609666 RepID=UPI0028857413|nr:MULTISPECIES: hypothetical protein [unclassified Halomonas]MDT0501515.1 hypothetical protein [Halomonas sp. PAR7]MDT0512803.1 hypothetical protein [Halomonas sp. LES1]MDT0591372.1 hypothetical protein [Halomonas sp. PAR8]